MKKYVTFIILLLIFSIISVSAIAESSFIEDLSALSSLREYIRQMVRNINDGAKEMMKIANMLICNSLHGTASYWEGDLGVAGTVKFHAIDPMFFLCGIILYILGFFILMVASFYMFDIALNISVTLLILPLGLALWPFGWTKDKLKPMIESVAYYTGLFIFLPLGILIGVKLVEGVAVEAIQNNGGGEKDIDLYEAFETDNVDALTEVFGLSSFGFLKMLLCYVIALRVIPLMATEFCTHFFGEGLLGNSIHEAFNQFTQILKEQTVGRMGKYGKNAAKAKIGNKIKDAGDKNGNIVDRTFYRYGKNVAKPEK